MVVMGRDPQSLSGAIGVNELSFPTLAEEDRDQSKVKRWEVPKGREASNAEATVLAHVTGAE